MAGFAAMCSSSNVREFGIEPIKVAGGTVKVKEELKTQFDIVAPESPS